MLKKLKEFIIGKPLQNEELQGEKLSVFWGLPIMASDAISSVAYAVEEILWVLVIIIGIAAYKYMFFASIAIVVLLLILVFSYRQTIDSYPHGGGSYTVSKENLGEVPGLIAGASLIIDYILTVAVSTSSGTAAITSALPALRPFNVGITLFLILLMTLGNLRGVKESARIFAIPTYIFVISMLVMIITGFFKIYVLGYVPESIIPIPNAIGDITLFLFVRAFAAGCAGLTGVEAVSNAIPSFNEPSTKNAKKVLNLLALLVLIIFGGTAFLSTLYHAVPSYDVTVLSQISLQVFGHGIWFYILQISTAIILVMAANSSFAGLPLLLSLVAADGYAPRQFRMRGDRLGFSNGILALSGAAAVLVIVYKAETHHLVPLYAVGVFISFTLSQLGMLMKWIRSKEAGRLHKILINGLGALMTFITVLSIAYSKMLEGAWITLVFIFVFVIVMKGIKRHYDDLARQLKVNQEKVAEEINNINLQKHMIVIVGSLNKASIKAINYARLLSEDKNLTAFHVSIDKEEGEKLEKRWEKFDIPVPLVVKYDPYRKIVGPLVEYIASEEHASKPNDMITVVIPQFVVSKKWHNLLHNQTAYAIRRRLIRDRHIAVITIPYVLDEKRLGTK